MDHNELEGVANRHHLPFGRRRIPTGEITYAVPRAPLSQVLDPIELDELTVVDDKEFLDRIAQQNNLPNFIKDGLPDFY